MPRLATYGAESDVIRPVSRVLGEVEDRWQNTIADVPVR
jgi:hypothetical protein